MQEQSSILPAVFSVSESADYLNVSAPTIWRMLREGVLPRVKVRRRTGIRRVDLDAFAESARDVA